jgi:hypothetical protein
LDKRGRNVSRNTSRLRWRGCGHMCIKIVYGGECGEKSCTPEKYDKSKFVFLTMWWHVDFSCEIG